jgi:hypothetical protein
MVVPSDKAIKNLFEDIGNIIQEDQQDNKKVVIALPFPAV